MKICIKCSLEKKLSEFNERKDSKDGYNNKCKKCKMEYSKQLKLSNPTYLENQLKLSKNYRFNNKDIIKEKSKKYYYDNREKHLKHKAKYQKKYLSIKDNIDRRNKKINIRFKERIKTDSLFALSILIKSSIKWAFKSRNYQKNSKTEKILGISFKEFKLYIETRFESWMTWENRGLYNGELNYGWDIDHIIPISSSKTEEELIKLNYYTNLQPLCSKINRDIKKDNIL